MTRIDQNQEHNCVCRKQGYEFFSKNHFSDTFHNYFFISQHAYPENAKVLILFKKPSKKPQSKHLS